MIPCLNLKIESKCVMPNSQPTEPKQHICARNESHIYYDNSDITERAKDKIKRLHSVYHHFITIRQHVFKPES